MIKYKGIWQIVRYPMVIFQSLSGAQNFLCNKEMRVSLRFLHLPLKHCYPQHWETQRDHCWCTPCPAIQPWPDTGWLVPSLSPCVKPWKMAVKCIDSQISIRTCDLCGIFPLAEWIGWDVAICELQRLWVPQRQATPTERMSSSRLMSQIIWWVVGICDGWYWSVLTLMIKQH